MTKTATALAVSANMVMVAACGGAARSQTYCPFTAIAIEVQIRVGVWIRKLHAALLAGVLVFVAYC